jgi:hypothetical protein
MAPKGGKFFHFFSSKRKSSAKRIKNPYEGVTVYDVTDQSFIERRSKVDGEIVFPRDDKSSVEKLETEVLELRRSLLNKDAEMQKLKNQVILISLDNCAIVSPVISTDLNGVISMSLSS